MSSGLAALEARVRDDLARTSHPSASWLEPKTTAIPKLVYGLTRGLFRADLAQHWNSFCS